MPSHARPPESTSRVVTVLASKMGCQYGLPVARASSLTRLVWAAPIVALPQMVYGAGAIKSSILGRLGDLDQRRANPTFPSGPKKIIDRESQFHKAGPPFFSAKTGSTP